MYSTAVYCLPRNVCYLRNHDKLIQTDKIVYLELELCLLVDVQVSIPIHYSSPVGVQLYVAILEAYVAVVSSLPESLLVATVNAPKGVRAKSINQVMYRLCIHTEFPPCGPCSHILILENCVCKLSNLLRS